MATNLNVAPIILVESIVATHFTTSLAQNAMEVESLTAPDTRNTDEFIIEAVTIITDAFDAGTTFDVMFFDQPTQTAVVDDDPFVERVNFPASSGVTVGTGGGGGQRYHSMSGLGIPYRDALGGGQIHVGLVNRTVAPKPAGATGEVKLKLWVRPAYFM